MYIKSISALLKLTETSRNKHTVVIEYLFVVYQKNVVRGLSQK